MENIKPKIDHNKIVREKYNNFIKYSYAILNFNLFWNSIFIMTGGSLIGIAMAILIITHNPWFSLILIYPIFLTCVFLEGRRLEIEDRRKNNLEKLKLKEGEEDLKKITKLKVKYKEFLSALVQINRITSEDVVQLQNIYISDGNIILELPKFKKIYIPLLDVLEDFILMLKK